MTAENRLLPSAAEMLVQLKWNGSVGLDMSPGDPVATWAYNRILELEQELKLLHTIQEGARIELLARERTNALHQDAEEVKGKELDSLQLGDITCPLCSQAHTDEAAIVLRAKILTFLRSQK